MTAPLVLPLPALVPQGELAMFELARLVKAKAITGFYRAKSLRLIDAWQDRGDLTAAGWRFVARIIRDAQPPGSTRTIPPVPNNERGPWWTDTTPPRQSLRGIKSGIVRRHREADRDEAIVKARNRGITIAAIAEHFRLSTRTIYRILARARHGVDISRRTIASTAAVIWDVSKIFRRQPRVTRTILENDATHASHAESAPADRPDSARQGVPGGFDGASRPAGADPPPHHGARRRE